MPFDARRDYSFIERLKETRNRTLARRAIATQVVANGAGAAAGVLWSREAQLRASSVVYLALISSWLLKQNQQTHHQQACPSLSITWERLLTFLAVPVVHLHVNHPTRLISQNNKVAPVSLGDRSQPSWFLICPPEFSTCSQQRKSELTPFLEQGQRAFSFLFHNMVQMSSWKHKQSAGKCHPSKCKCWASACTLIS